MDSLLEIGLDRLHHAYLVVGGRDAILSELRKILSKLGIVTDGNPDATFEEFDAFLLNDAARLRGLSRYHSADGGKKIFVVAFNTMGIEAQNALLKTLEEPTAGTHIFLVTHREELLIPTVRSRMQIISHQPGVSGHQPGEKFLAASIPERMKLVEPLTRAKDEEKPKAKESARKLLEQIEGELLETKGESNALEEVLKAKSYLGDRAPSLKLILEHLALTLPISES